MIINNNCEVDFRRYNSINSLLGFDNKLYTSGFTSLKILLIFLLSSAVIGMETVTIVLGLLRVVGFRAIKKIVQNRKKNCDISCFSTISSLISKALSDDSISAEEYSLICME